MRDDFQPAVYILARIPRDLTYIGVTSNLVQRIAQHRDGSFPGFANRYALRRLMVFELFGTMDLAIAREKQLKNWHRGWKHGLMVASNPDWCDLAEGLGFLPLA